MNALLQTAAFEALRYATLAWTHVVTLWDTFWDWYHWVPESRPTHRYFLTLTGTDDFEGTETTVPEDAIYVEEWILAGAKKCVVRYPGDVIPDTWDVSPHLLTAKCPWIWVGDRNTEIDLTQTFAKFLVPGNRITMDLVERLIRVTDQTRLVYIEYGSFEEKEFPGDGLLIKANGPL
jgi:hypothetical protein